MKLKKSFIGLFIIIVICLLSPVYLNAAESYKVIWLNKDISHIETFHNGYASVFNEIGYKWNMLYGYSGCIDKSGKIVVPLKYDRGAYHVGDGLVVVSDDPTDGREYEYVSRSGYFDIKTGKEILPPIYDYLGGFIDGIAMVNQYQSYSRVGPSKYGFIDRKGKIILPVIYDSVSNFINGYAFVSKDKKWYLVDKTGKVVKTLQYDKIHGIDSKEGIVADIKDGKLGFMDTMGNEIIPTIYDSVLQEFSDGIAILKHNGKSVIIDKNGKQLFETFSDGVRYIGGGFFVDYQNGKCRFIDKNGKSLTKSIYSYNWSFLSDDLLMVERNGKVGCIDRTGKEVIPVIYDELSEFIDGMSSAKKDGKSYFVDKSGKSYFYPYDTIENFRDGVAIVSKAYKYGIINKAGKVIVPLNYDSLSYTEASGLYWAGKYDKTVKKQNVYPIKYALMNKSGKLLTQPLYSELYLFSEGLVVVNRNGKYGYMDKNGKEVIPCIFDYVNQFVEGVAEVRLNNRWGLIKYPFTVMQAF